MVTTRTFCPSTSVAIWAWNARFRTSPRTKKLNTYRAGRRIRIPLSDLPIGVTALELGYRVGTHNVRHFQLIPDLKVVQF